MASTAQGSIGTGDFLGQTFKIFGDARNDALTYILVIGGLSALGVILGWTETTATSLGWSAGFSIDQTDTLASGLFEIVAAIIGIVAGYMLLRRYLAAQGRQRVDDNRFWPYLGTAILSGIAIGLGILFLVVPGLFLMVRWAASSGFVIGRGEGVTDSLKASWHATKGHGWGIFLAALVLFIGGVAIAGIVGGGLAAINATLGGVLSAFIEAAFGAMLMAFGIGVYTLVADDARQTAEVFE